MTGVATGTAPPPDACMRLGAPSLYCLRSGNAWSRFETFEEFMQAAPAAPAIDPTGLIEIINRGYCFGTRTTIRGLHRVPVDGSRREGGFEPSGEVVVPRHGHRRLEPEAIARELFELLCAELARACRGKKRVGLLLSGGMDSRVVACVLSTLQGRGELDADIAVLTWGVEGCRDVVYAHRIAEGYGWEFRWFPIDAALLADNIATTARLGCEFSPLHLHALPRIALESDLDLVLAASFGDSVGRAEFSGEHVTQLKPIARHIYNRFRVLKGTVFGAFTADVHQDAERYAGAVPGAAGHERREVDRQFHYMQRMLVPCFDVITERTPVYQAFTSPQVYGYMWSLDPACRTDWIYLHLLSQRDSDLLEIPWARTGKPYLEAAGRPDGLEPNHNRYGLWMRTEIRELVRARVLSGRIARLGVFNMRSLDSLLRYSERGSGDKATRIQDILAWIASLDELLERYDVRGPGMQPESTFVEYANGRIISPLHALGFDGKLAWQRLGRRLGGHLGR